MTSPLTVLQLLPALDAGGVELATLETAQALTAAGHRAIVVSAGGRLLPRLLATGAEHIALDIGRKSPLTLRHVLNLRRLLRHTPVDIVHARSRLPAWVGLWALRSLPRPSRPAFVTSVHGLNSPSRYSAVMTYGNRVICVSRTVRDYVLRHYPRTDPRRLRLIMDGIDNDRFHPVSAPRMQMRAALAAMHPALAGDGPLLLLPGRGTRLKGHADALQLLAGLRGQAGCDARLWLPGARQSGREAYIAELDALARELGVAEAVLFSEPVTDMPRAYAASDLVLQLSRKPEAFGRSVGEALAMGVPVLGWDHGGAGELLAELQPHGAVPPFDAAALLATARILLASPPAPLSRIPYTLAATQHATLELYAELVRHR